MLAIWANLGIVLVFAIVVLLGSALVYMLLAILEELFTGKYKKRHRKDDTDGFYVF